MALLTKQTSQATAITFAWEGSQAGITEPCSHACNSTLTLGPCYDEPRCGFAPSHFCDCFHISGLQPFQSLCQRRLMHVACMTHMHLTTPDTYTANSVQTICSTCNTLADWQSVLSPMYLCVLSSSMLCEYQYLCVFWQKLIPAHSMGHSMHSMM